jgi:DNA-binding IscR family transcriptional regulator
MLTDAKWLSYAIGVLAASNQGAHTIQAVSEHVGGSESYIAKVIAVLRKAGFINARYELAKPLDQILIKDLLALTYQGVRDEKYIKYIVEDMILSLKLSVADVLKSYAECAPTTGTM